MLPCNGCGNEDPIGLRECPFCGNDKCDKCDAGDDVECPNCGNDEDVEGF